jgi:3-phosphoshikimate 1-carboxyvinyltransferase
MPDYTLPLDELPDPLPIEPLRKPFDVTITPPGSKSITNRAYVLAALADGTSRIMRPLRSDDCDLLLDALCTLGAEAQWDGEDVLITGVNGRFPRGGEANLGDGGTPTRFMIACACLAAQPVVVDGSARMRERPIAEGVDMLRQLGAQIQYVEEEGRLPVRVTPSEQFRGGQLEVGKTASSQFISAVMLIGSVLPLGVTIHATQHMTSAKYVLLTLSVMRAWECDVQNNLEFQDGDTDRWESETASALAGTLSVNRGHVMPREYLVEPDASSAIYLLAAASVNPRSVALIPGLHSTSRKRANHLSLTWIAC